MEIKEVLCFQECSLRAGTRASGEAAKSVVIIPSGSYLSLKNDEGSKLFDIEIVTYIGFSAVSFRAFRSFRLDGFVSLFRVLVLAVIFDAKGMKLSQ